MRLLEYKIAWVDDQPQKANGYYENINNRLGRSGFSVKVDWIASAQQLAGFLGRLQASSDYDVIMVDWKLGKMVPDGQTGISVAKQIRAHNSFATIIFYSAEMQSVLATEIADQRIDGVFCVNRQHFVSEAMNIIKASIRKFSDLTAMRGLFLAAVAEFDHLIRDAALKAYKDAPAELQKKVKDKIIDDAIEFFAKGGDRARALDRSADLADVLDNLRAGSKQIADCLIHILSTAQPTSQHVDALKKLKDYEADILVTRNDMAHVKEENRGGRRCLVRGAREWDETNFDKLRATLQEHHENMMYIDNPIIGELIEHLRQTLRNEGVKGA